MDFSLSIGIDKYLDLNDTPFAENDAKGFNNLMKNLYKIKNPELLLRDRATYSNINRTLRNIASKLDKGDRFFFFFAGHGININSIPYISCYDTYPTDGDTLISIIQIIEMIGESGCDKNIYFIDACESTIKLGSRKIKSKFSLDFLEKKFLENSYCNVFSSTSHKGVADINKDARHGIWTYFLLKALSGDDEKALNEKLWLTNNTLQNYLSICLKSYCKGDPSITVQNSFKWGKEEGEYIIRKFERKEDKKI